MPTSVEEPTSDHAPVVEGVRTFSLRWLVVAGALPTLGAICVNLSTASPPALGAPGPVGNVILWASIAWALCVGGLLAVHRAFPEISPLQAVQVGSHGGLREREYRIILPRQRKALERLRALQAEADALHELIGQCEAEADDLARGLQRIGTMKQMTAHRFAQSFAPWRLSASGHKLYLGSLDLTHQAGIVSGLVGAAGPYLEDRVLDHLPLHHVLDLPDFGQHLHVHLPIAAGITAVIEHWELAAEGKLDYLAAAQDSGARISASTGGMLIGATIGAWFGPGGLVVGKFVGGWVGRELYNEYRQQKWDTQVAKLESVERETTGRRQELKQQYGTWIFNTGELYWKRTEQLSSSAPMPGQIAGYLGSETTLRRATLAHLHELSKLRRRLPRAERRAYFPRSTRSWLRANAKRLSVSASGGRKRPADAPPDIVTVIQLNSQLARAGLGAAGCDWSAVHQVLNATRLEFSRLASRWESDMDLQFRESHKLFAGEMKLAAEDFRRLDDEIQAPLEQAMDEFEVFAKKFRKEK